MSLWAEKENWPRVANFFEQQAIEELLHADRLENYLLDIDYDIRLEDLPAGRAEYDDLLDVFNAALEHEKKVTANFDEIMKEAKEVGDYRTESQAFWFVNEQVEEEATFNDLICLLEKIIDSPAALLEFDAGLAKRKTELPF